MVGRVPLPVIPFFLAANSSPTIPHMYSKQEKSPEDGDYVDGRPNGPNTAETEEAMHALVYTRPCMYAQCIYWYVLVYTMLDCKL